MTYRAPSARPVDVVFGRPRVSGSRRWSRRLFPWVLAVGGHALVAALALTTEPSLETWCARTATAVHDELQLMAPTQVEVHQVRPPKRLEPQPQPPAPEAPRETSPPPPSPTRPSKVVTRPAVKTVRNAPRRPSTSREAAKVLGALTEPEAVADFGDTVFVTGNSSAYQGGVTTDQAAAPPAVVAPVKKSPSLAGPVRLASPEWRCSWPQAALDADVFEQSVVVVVRVNAQAKVVGVKVLDDPGLGFAEAARRCARKTRFFPATDASGVTISASSPPIRVRFTR